MTWFDRLLRRRAVLPSMVDPSHGLAVVEARTADGWHAVHLSVGSARVSDALNDAAPDLQPRLVDGTPVSVDDLLVLIPPATAAGDPARKLHRPARQLWVRLGEASVTGSLHLPPGTVGSAFLLRRNHRFFVLTDARFSHPLPDGGREEVDAPALLVNLARVSSLRDTPEPEAAPAMLGAPPA